MLLLESRPYPFHFDVFFFFHFHHSSNLKKKHKEFLNYTDKEPSKISRLYRHRTQQVHQAFLNEIAELGEVCKSPPWSQHFDPTLPPITTWKIQSNEVWCLPKGPCDDEALLPFLELHHAVPLHFQHHVPVRWVSNCASLAEMNVLLQHSCGSLYGPMSSKLARVSLLCHLKTTRTNSKTTSLPIV